MHSSFDIQLTLQGLVALNLVNLVLIPALSITALAVNIPIVGPIFAKGCALAFGH